MKRFAAILLVLACLLSLFSCAGLGGHQAATEAPSSEAPEVIESTESTGSTEQTGSSPLYEEDLIDTDRMRSAELEVWEDYSTFGYTDHGMNDELTSDVTVRVFFVDDSDFKWDEDSINHCLENRVYIAFDFLKREAAKYGREIEFDYETYSSSYKEGYVLLRPTSTSANMTIEERVAHQLGFDGVEELYEDWQQRHYAECKASGKYTQKEQLWLFMLPGNDDGVEASSRKRNVYTNPNNVVEHIEYCAVYNAYSTLGKDADMDNYLAFKIANRVLYLYGAHPMFLNDKIERIFLEAYPTEIMLGETFYKIEDMSVSPITAYAVGWVDELDDTEIMRAIDTPSELAEIRVDYDVGACKTLKGDVAVVLFFMDDYESSWSKEDANEYVKLDVLPALKFLEDSAMQYGVELNATLEKTYKGLYYDGDVKLRSDDAGRVTRDVLDQAAGHLGYSDDTEMMEALREQYGTEEVICIAIFNKVGVGYGINPKERSGIDIDEHIVAFAYESKSVRGFYGYNASLIACDILYMYGAETLSNRTRRTICDETYPNDILRKQMYIIDNNYISEVTAFYIGWINRVPEVFYDIGW